MKIHKDYVAGFRASIVIIFAALLCEGLAIAFGDTFVALSFGFVSLTAMAMAYIYWYGSEEEKELEELHRRDQNWRNEK